MLVLVMLIVSPTAFPSLWRVSIFSCLAFLLSFNQVYVMRKPRVTDSVAMDRNFNSISLGFVHRSFPICSEYCWWGRVLLSCASWDMRSMLIGHESMGKKKTKKKKRTWSYICCSKRCWRTGEDQPSRLQWKEVNWRRRLRECLSTIRLFSSTCSFHSSSFSLKSSLVVFHIVSTFANIWLSFSCATQCHPVLQLLSSQRQSFFQRLCSDVL